MQTSNAHGDQFKVATWLLLIISAGCFLNTVGSGVQAGEPNNSLALFGSVDPVRIWWGEPWRFLTALFVFDGLLDFVINAFILLQLGRSLEYLIGPSRMLLVFFVTGMGAFAASILVNMSIVAGMSGALFGVAGALLVLLSGLPRAPEQTRFLKGLGLIVAINLALGFFSNAVLAKQTGLYVDNAVHIAGLMLGILMGYGFLPDTQTSFLVTKMTKATSRSVFALAISMGLFMSLVSFALKPSFSPRYQFLMGNAALTVKELTKAKAHRLSLMELGKTDTPEAALLGARIAAYEGNEKSQIKYLREALLLVPGASDLLSMSIASFSGLMSPKEALFADEAGHGFLCDEIIRADASKNLADANLKECAWLFLHAKDKRVNNGAKGLMLAKAAALADKNAKADSLYILAQAYAETKDYTEAVATLQRAELLGPQFSMQKKLEDDRRRMERLAMKADGQF
jgi:membrane associated rhomboid family serine protease